jgi:outer membrane biosynthesis protein TonB
MAQAPRICVYPLLALAAILSALTLAPAALAVQAQKADDVVESIGVNTHIGYMDTNYDEFPMVRQRLQELGIRYIRDHISQGRPDVYSRMRTLAGDGIRLNVIAGDPLRRWNIGTIDQQLDLIQKELSSSVVSIEGPNEYDLQGDSNWVSVLRTYTKQLWEGVKARPKLAGLPVIGPSIVSRTGMATVGDLSAWVDYGNTHTYLSGAMPETESVWSGELSAAAKNSGTKPVQVTETGYHNGVSSTAGHQPASEKATGIYMPRLFLENFRRGTTPRSFSYELLDQRDDPSKTDIEAAFGLLRNDFSKKPAATAIERLIGLLSDKGSVFSPSSLDYSLEGAPSTARQLLLQKRDGSFYLVLWNRVSVWDQSKRADVNPADASVTLKLGQPIAGAEVYEPNTAATAVSSASNPTSLKLNLSERVTVVKLVPADDVDQPQPAPAPVPQPEPAPAPQPAPAPAPVPAPAPAPQPEPAPAPSPSPAPEPAPAPAPAPQPEPVAEEPAPVEEPQPPASAPQSPGKGDSDRRHRPHRREVRETRVTRLQECVRSTRPRLCRVAVTRGRATSESR